MRKSTLSNAFYYFVGLIVFFFIWWIISLVIKETTMIFPNPIDTIIETFRILKTKYIYQCIFSSLLRMMVGFVISIVIAFILGIIAGNFPSFKKVLFPTITALKSIPTASLVFLFLVLMGARKAPILMVILISFPIIYESLVGGIEQIDSNINDAVKVDCKSFIRKVFRIQIPLSFPYLLVGISSSFGLAFKIEIMAEILTGDTKSGLGSAINVAQKNDPINMIPIFSYSLIAIAIVLLISFLCSFIKKKCQKYC